MTVTTTSSRISYTGDGTSVAFPFPYYFLAATDIEVFLNFVTQGAGFTVTGAGNPLGGTVTFGAAPAAGVPILLARVPDLLQGTDLPPNDPFPSDAVEKALDKLTMIAQELSADQGRSVHFPLSETVDGTLPLSGQRANKVYAFDVNGNPTLVPMPSSLGAGDLRWENGNDGTRGFKTGVDFTPNVTAQLTLSRSPISDANVWAYWDGVEQTDFTISAGNKINFPTAIPSGVSVVNVRIGTTLSLNIPGQGSVGTDSLADGAVTDAKVSTTSTLYRRIADLVNVKDPAYGAKGDGVTDDTAAIVACLNANAGKVVYFPKGTYIFKTPTTLASGNNVSLFGDGAGSTIIKAVGVTLNNNGLLTWVSADGFSIDGIAFDFNNCAVTVGSEQVVGMINCNNFRFENSKILNLTGGGLVGNGITNFSIRHNYFSKAVPSGTYNQAINIESTSGQSADGVVEGNVCNGSGTDFSAARVKIRNNTIFNWKFGAGITTEQAPTSASYIIEGNVMFGGAGTDVNATNPSGIEHWAPYSVVRGNLCYSNSGDGISAGGFQNVISDNICYNNGQVAGNGISARFGTSVYNASFSVFSGNQCFDSQGTKTQSYGYQEQAGGLQNITISHTNNFDGSNKLAPVSMNSSVQIGLGPILEATTTVTPGTIANGGSAQMTLTLAGAVFNDMCIASFSQDVAGCSMSANVSSTNTVRVTFSNNTGSSQTIANGQLRVKAFKPATYAQF